MKKHPRLHQMQSHAVGSRVLHAHSRSSIYWIFIVAICFVVFILTVGLANAAQNGGGPLTLSQKEQRVQQLLNAGRKQMRAKPVNQNQMPAVQPTPARQSGISNMRQGPFPRATFTVQNFWQGPIGNDWVLAYSGAKAKADGTPGQGGIVLYTETINKSGGVDLHPLGMFLAPNGTTVLTITAANGNQLQLSSTAGQQLTFNLTTHQFS